MNTFFPLLSLSVQDTKEEEEGNACVHIQKHSGTKNKRTKNGTKRKCERERENQSGEDDSNDKPQIGLESLSFRFPHQPLCYHSGWFGKPKEDSSSAQRACCRKEREGEREGDEQRGTAH